MTSEPKGDSAQIQDFARLRSQTMDLAHQYRGDAFLLLELLRTLEAVHREIRDGLFHDSLPNSRQQLYGILKEVEEGGGWPYISRMQIQNFLVHVADLEIQSQEGPPGGSQEEG